MFSVEERDRIRDRVLALAARDPRVVAGAAVGSLANGGGDRFSDLDLTFGVAGCAPAELLDDWQRVLAEELAAVRLFDVQAGPALYRVLLFPGALQVDLSAAPAAEFGARGPAWELLFGEAVERTPPSLPPADELLGLAVHHALRARFCVERGRVWQAEYWLGELRNLGLSLARRNRGLPSAYGRGLDDLPAEALAPFAEARVRSLERDELLRALGCAVDALLREAGDGRRLADAVEADLRGLTAPGWAGR